MKAIQLISVFSIICLTACSPGKTKQLTATPWIVYDAILESPDKYQKVDTTLERIVETELKKRVYIFNEDGTYSINTGSKTLSGKWNFAKDDTAQLWHDMGAKSTMVVMRSNDGREEVWTPWTNKSSVFVNYLDEDIIQTVLVPSLEEGNIYLTLHKK